MSTIQKLIEDVSTTHTLYLHEINSITEIQASWKEDPQIWNIIEITEHLFLGQAGRNLWYVENPLCHQVRQHSTNL